MGGFKRYLPLLVVIALIAVVSATTTTTTKEDPELKTCKHQCRQTKQFGEQEIKKCEEQCEEYSKEKQRREKKEEKGKGEEQKGKRSEEEKGGKGEVGLEEENPDRFAPEWELQPGRYDQPGRRFEQPGRYDPEFSQPGRRYDPQRQHPHRFDPEFQQPWRGSRGTQQQRGTEGCECQRGRRQQEEFGFDEGSEEWGIRRQTRQQHEREQQPWRRQQQQHGREQPWRRQQEEEEEEFGGGRRHHQQQQPWRRHQQPWRRQEEEREEEQEYGIRGHGGEGHPYVFKDEHFQTKFSSQQGRERFLPKFSEVSRLLRGIENFRVDIFEARPMTFVLPKHCDADAILFVAKGRGTITLVHPDNKESFNLEKGHIMRVKAGTSVYLVNSDEEERLVLVKLIKPVSNIERFETFFGAGGQNPESFFTAFSDDILEASFKSSSDELDRIFNQQDEGVVVKATREQIQSLSKGQQQPKMGGGREEEAGSRGWPFGGGRTQTKGSSRSGPINLFRQKPKFKNEFGSLFEIDADDFPQLNELDVAVSFANVTEGGMIAPHFNTRATKIAVVVKGQGRFEMACPHVGHEQQQRRRQQQGSRQFRHRGGERFEQQTPVHYQKITGELSVGTVFIVPTGHPFVTVASQDENLQIICFEVNAENNKKIQLAGQRSILKQFEQEAKELAFGESAEFIDEILERQDEEFFFAGPELQQHQRQPHHQGGRGQHHFRPGREQQQRGREEGVADQ